MSDLLESDVNHLIPFHNFWITMPSTDSIEKQRQAKKRSSVQKAENKEEKKVGLSRWVTGEKNRVLF